MKYICTVSVAMRLGFWLFVVGVGIGLFLGVRV